MTSSLRTRIERLEGAAGLDNVTLEEAVYWSYQQRSGPAYEEFAKRLENSRLGQLIRAAYETRH